MNQMPNKNYDKIAIVFGATGQIGSYLCEHLLAENYGKVVGVARRSSLPNQSRLQISLAHDKFEVASGDITDPASLLKLFSKCIVDKDLKYEIYNLAAQSFVAVSFQQPGLTLDVTGKGHLNVLEAALPFHDAKFNLHTYFMSSSETWGKNKDLSGFQSLDTQMYPSSPYGIAKLYAFHMNRVYRESYGMWNSSGIVFNTESPRRGEEFVTRKITKWFGKYAWNFYKNTSKLQLGNLDVYRDWTHARDTVRAIHLINTASRPKDYIVASGETHSLLEFLSECYEQMQKVCGTCNTPLADLYGTCADFIRPNEVPYLKGQADIINQELGWKPTISFKELVREMFSADYANSVATND